MQGWLKKAQTGVARAKQQAMAKMGRADETVDVTFNQVSQQFKENHEKLKRLSKYVHGYEDAVKNLAAAQTGMAQMVMDQYEGHCALYRAATLYQKCSADVENLRQALEQRYDEGFHAPLSQYLGQYKTIDARIEERNLRLVDMDRYKFEVKSMMEKGGAADPVRLQNIQEKAANATRMYEDLNLELLKDIPRLLEDRYVFFDSLFANLVDGQIQHFTDASRILSEMQSSLAQAPRISNHSWVITDESVSAFNRAAYMPGGASGAPPQAGGPPQMQQQASAGGMPQQQMQQSQSFGSGNYGQQQQPVMQQQQQPMMQQQQQQPQSSLQQSQSFGGGAIPERAPPRPAGTLAQALYPFQGQDESELTFQYNDTINVTRQGGEWWEGELNGRRGLFPANYVKLL